MAIPFVFENIVGATVDITKYVTQVDSCRFQGSGKIRSLSLMLNASAGAFVTNADYEGVNSTPVINQFDKFKITWTDKNAVQKKLIAEVDTELGQDNLNGQLLPLEFKGREAALQRKKFTSFFQFKTPQFVIQFIRDFYNTGKGTDEPTLSTSGDSTNFIETVPDNIVNIYDFTKEVTFYDAIMQVIRRLNQPVGQGGVGDFFSLVFTDGEDLITPQADTVIMRIFVQGVGAATNIQSSVNDPIHSITYQIEAESGNQVLVRGQQGTGYVPTEFHEFISFVEEINNYPAYDTTQTYIIGIFVRGGDNAIYSANAAVPINTPPPNILFWDLETPNSIIGTLNYSQWTKDKVTVTKNGMANPTGTFLDGTFNAPAFYDGNMVIREGGTNSIDGTFTFWRDWALLRTNTTVGLATNPYFDFAGTFGFYKGTRVLVDASIGAVGGDFIGTDKFGRTFADSLAFYTGDEWIVIREFDGITTSLRLGNQVVVIFEGRTYEWNVAPAAVNDFANAHTHSTWNPRQRGPGAPLGVQWRDVSATAGGNDVFHHPKSITNVAGLFPSDIIGDDYTTFITNSALKIVFEYDLDSILDEWFAKFTSFWDNLYTVGKNLMEGLDDNFQNVFEPTVAQLAETQISDYYEFGWWYSLPFPYPFSTHNVITEKVGDLWGAAPGINQKRDFAVLDLQNPTYTHSGLVGFNNTEVEDIGGPFTALRFYFLFDIKLGGVASKPLVGNIPFTVTAYDDLSQVWRADFTYRFLKDAQEITIGFDEFTVDRPSRTPWGIRTVFQNIVTPEVEIRSIFEPKRVRFITIQLSDSYDDYDRYLPVTLENIVATFFGLGILTFEGTIDGLTLLKQPFTSSGVITDRIINPETVQLPNTRNLRQLRSVAIATKDLHELQFESFTVNKDLDCSFTTEQAVNLISPDMVKGSPRKLVLMAEDFTWNPTGPNAGGISKKTLTRRLNP